MFNHNLSCAIQSYVVIMLLLCDCEVYVITHCTNVDRPCARVYTRRRIKIQYKSRVAYNIIYIIYHIGTRANANAFLKAVVESDCAPPPDVYNIMCSKININLSTCAGGLQERKKEKTKTLQKNSEKKNNF